MTGEPQSPSATISITGRSGSPYSPTRRTAVILVGEGTSTAYLAGALKGLDEAGVRFDLLLGKGGGALVAALGAVSSGEQLYGPQGLFSEPGAGRPWRWRAPYLVAGLCLLATFAVFVSPALVSMLRLVVQPPLAAARIVAPGVVERLVSWVQSLAGPWAGASEPLYLRAMAFPLAVLFAYLVVFFLVPALLRGRTEGGRWAHVLGEGLLDLSPLAARLERRLWEAVRGATIESWPTGRAEIGTRYRDLLSENLGQPGFRELLFYALDQDTGQEVPFALVKDRWLARLGSRGPGGGAVGAEVLSLAGEDSALLFDALLAALSPPGLAPPVPIRLPVSGRHGGEVHRFSSSLLSGASAVADAVSAGAEQIIYVSASPSTGVESGGVAERLAAAAIRQQLENDLRWAERERPGLVFFLIRPERQKLGLYAFRGRALPGGQRLMLDTLLAQGQRNAQRLFIQPMVGEAPTARAIAAPSDPTIQL
jgi:hypothetical protein